MTCRRKIYEPLRIKPLTGNGDNLYTCSLQGRPVGRSYDNLTPEGLNRILRQKVSLVNPSELSSLRDSIKLPAHVTWHRPEFLW